jgi:ribonuclease M5
MQDQRIAIQEVIVVEGKNDVAAVKRAVLAEVIVTEGFILSKNTLERIKVAQAKCGVIILTDPDTVGEKLRERINAVVPGCKHAFLPKADALKNGDVGIENARPETIREALFKVRTPLYGGSPIFTLSSLMVNGLVGGVESSEQRARVGKILGIGYTNGKQFLNRLNHYGVSMEEFLDACRRATTDD